MGVDRVMLAHERIAVFWLNENGGEDWWGEIMQKDGSQIKSFHPSIHGH